MAVLNPPFALQNAGATHTAQGDRLMLGGLHAGRNASGSFAGRGGVAMGLGGSLWAQQTGTPSMAVEVLSGICYVPGTESNLQGVYCCINDGTVTKTVTAAHGTLPRIDSVVARVYDSAYSGATNTWDIEVIAGTAAASPVAPTLPNNAQRLWNINVGAAVSSITNANLSDVRRYATSIGGIISCTAADEPALADVAEGQAVWRRDLGGGTLRFKQGGLWVTRSTSAVMQSGSASVTFSSKSVHTQTVTFPSAFASTPRVFVNIANTASVTAGWITRGYNISTTNFTLYLAQVNGVTVSWSGVEVQWHAIQ